VLSEFWHDLRYRARALLRPADVQHEIDEELRYHLDREAAKHVEDGAAPADAARRARLALGGVERVREATRDAHGAVLITTAMQDLRYAGRMLRKSPTFTVVAMTAIAVGSGAVTTIVSAANALLLRPIPGVSAPEQLVDLTRTAGPGTRSPQTASYLLYIALRDQSRTLTGIAAWSPEPLTVNAGGQGTSAFANLVSDNYFAVLGVRPLLGRFFSAGDDREPGSHAEIVLSEGFWRRRLGGDATLLGRPLSVNGVPYVVIGVAPAAFDGVIPMVRTDAWVPIGMANQLRPGTDRLSNPRGSWLMLFGRLASGSSVASATAEEAVILSRLKATSTAIDPDARMSVTPATGLPGEERGRLLGFVALLLVIATLVLLIASVNVAGMLLARAMARRHEMAIRVALGAGRRRIIRQLLTESVVLFLGGASGGFLIALWTTRLASRFQFRLEVPISVDLSPDYRVLAIALGMALVTGIVFGLAPALEATRIDPSLGLRSDTAGSGVRRSPLRQVLVTGQLAVSLVLLMAAGLFLRALDRGLRIPTGFDATGVATAPFDVSTAGYSENRARLFYDALRQRLLATSGVTGVSYVQPIPLTNSTYSQDFTIEGYRPPAGEFPDGRVDVDLATVATGYFSAVRIPIVRGRDFAATDDADAPDVAVINQAFARAYWPGADPVGRTLEGANGVITVVGVARNAKYSSLNQPLAPFLYLPLAQNWTSSVHLLVRTSGSAAALPAVIRDAVRAIDPILPEPPGGTLQAATSLALLPQRIAALVTGAMGALGLLLALVGLYGALAYRVSQRTREIGVRMALGANRRTVVRMVVRDGMRLVAMGTAIGMVIAVAATRLMGGFLFGVSPLDPLVFALIPVTLVAAAFVAVSLPASTAAATDPLVALRSS
jgi:predicted permease